MDLSKINAYDIANAFESGVLIIDDTLNPVFMNEKGYEILGIKEELMKDHLPTLLYSFGFHNFIEGNKTGVREKINYNGYELVVHVTSVETETFNGEMIEFNKTDVFKSYVDHIDNEFESSSLIDINGCYK